MPALTRRLMLQAGGACLALPWLESFARASEGPVYTVFVRQGNGVTQGDSGADESDRFWPHATGTITPSMLASQSDRVVSELSAWADRMTLVKGLDYQFANNGCGHSGGGNQLLTAAQVSDDPSGNLSLAMGESIDNRLARAFPNNGGEPLCLYTGPRNGYIEEVMSYRGAKDLRAAEDDPFNAYQRMIGVELDGLVLERRLSVNDLLLEQIDALLNSPALSSSDRQRLDLHFESVRDFELLACRLSEDEEQAMASVTGQGVLDTNRLLVARMHMDLIALCFACDYARSATLQIGDGNDGTRYTIDGEVQPSFHWISHRIMSDSSDGDPIPGAVDKHHAIDRMMANTFAHLLDRLEEHGVLQDSVAVWTSDLGNGVAHSYSNIPFVMVGEGGGRLRTGQFIDFGGLSHNLLFTTLANVACVTEDDGSPVDHFGDESLPSGVLDELLTG